MQCLYLLERLDTVEIARLKRYISTSVSPESVSLSRDYDISDIRVCVPMMNRNALIYAVGYTARTKGAMLRRAVI